MGVRVTGGANYRNITSDTLCSTQPGDLVGIFCASASGSPTIKVWDNTAGSGTILVNTFTPVGSTWYLLPFPFKNGLFISIGATVDCTVCFS